VLNTHRGLTMGNEVLNRYVSLELEDAYGVENSSANTIYYGEVDDESFATRMDLLTRQDMSHYGSTKSVTGGEYSEGGYNMAVQLDTFLGATLLAFFPKYSFSDPLHIWEEPTDGTHAYATDADSYDSYTIRVGREDKEHTYVGMMANRLSLTANVGEYVMLSCDWVGCREKATATLTNTDGTLSFEGDALDALYFSNGTVTFNNSGNTAVGVVKSVSFEINMNRDTDNAYALGNSTYVRQPPSQRREVTGTIEFNQIIHSANNLDGDAAAIPTYDTLVAEDGLAYNPGSSNDALTLLFEEESNGTTNFLKMEFFNIRFEAPEASVSGRDTQTMSVGFVALYDDTTESMMKVTADGGDFGTSAIVWNA